MDIDTLDIFIQDIVYSVDYIYSITYDQLTASIYTTLHVKGCSCIM